MLLLELHQLNGMTNLHAFWDFAIRLYKRPDFFTTGHNNVTFRCVNVDTFGLLLVAYGY